MVKARAARVAPLLVTTGATLLVALWAGLARVGWSLGAAPRVVVAHGPLMVVGVLGTVISIERAVAVGRLWALLAPVFSLAAALGLVLGVPAVVCAWSSVAGAAVLCAALAVLAARGRDLAALVIGLGGLAFLAGCARWALGAPVFVVLPFWTAWLVLTIAGERLELTRVMPPSAIARGTLVTLAVALCASPFLPAAARGVVLVGVAAWLLRFDVARRVIRRPGLPRFTAITLLSGYAWLAIAGALLFALGDVPAGPYYDAATHAVMLGFVFAMIFGHAPTILPATIGVPLPFRRVFYAHVALLHVGLATRIAGDLGGLPALRTWGGMLNATAILLFAASSVASVARGPQRAAAVTSP